MALDIPGLIGVIVFYIAILVIGLLAGRKKSSDSNSQFLANRDLGVFVASFTLSATMVGGAYINGTAEEVARRGIIYINAPLCLNLGIVIAAIVIAPKVRKAGYSTIFDPLQSRFGEKMGALLFFNEFFANLFWGAAILGALGSSLSLILDLDVDLCIVISACVAIAYTFFGGLYSVAYTDIIQLIFMAIGLVLAIPFAFTNEAVDISSVKDTWVGTLPTSKIGVYIDMCLLCVFGGIPWQVYYQRVLACRSPSAARTSSLIGTFMATLMLIPPTLIGIAGSAADWNMTSFETSGNLTSDQLAAILPMSVRYLCPTAVSVVGLGAISASVMSSADSLVLATGSVFAKNIYNTLFRPKASDREIVWVLRISILVVGAASTALAIVVHSIFALFVLCTDLMYVAHFPQFVCALWFEGGNTYGSLCGFVVALLLRCLGGEPALKMPVVLKYPMFDETSGEQLFPYKTLAMLCSLGTLVGVSLLTNFIFTRNIIGKKFDIFHCFQEEVTEKDAKDVKMLSNEDEQTDKDKSNTDRPLLDKENGDDETKL
ncbi:hypothetical protein FSP39_006486 [Pinctada imbricata]|uniref:High-affinity choline transporter 1 n=1 Tax=Pinctada imbricata TaxID=66713 RepID=A0AA88XMN3_PINIB|nr:hypothetical protein FSP39_006486 [Pinctada imbricata]